jgi:micrococcal nuclease
MLYNYKVNTIVKIIDGDTLDVILDLGFNIFAKKRIRIYGINCPECRTRNKAEKARGLAAKKFLRELLESFDGDIFINSKGLGKYGRVLGEIKLQRPKEFRDVAEAMIMAGHAEEYSEGKK